MNWYVLHTATGREPDVCEGLRRKGLQTRAPKQRMQIRRRGQWQEEERLLLPGYVFVCADYSATVFHLAMVVPGVIRWLGMDHGEPTALGVQDILRWNLEGQEVLGPSRVLFYPGGAWSVLDGPLAAFAADEIRMDRRQRRAWVTVHIGGGERRVCFAVTPVDHTGPVATAQKK